MKTNASKNNPHAVVIPNSKYRSLSKYIIFSVTLFLLIFVVGTTAFLDSKRQIIRVGKGNELTKLLEVECPKIEAIIDKEVTDILTMAASPMVRRYFENPDNEALKEMAMNEIGAYSEIMRGSVFWINDIDRLYHIEGREPFLLDPINEPKDSWYLRVLNETQNYAVSANYSDDLNVTRLWINVPVFDRSRRNRIGIIGSGIDISELIGNVYSAYDNRNTNFNFYIFNNEQRIVGAKDISLIADRKRIKDVLALSNIDEAILDSVKNLNPGEVRTFAVPVGQVAITSIPMFEWYAIAILPDSLEDFKTPMTIIFFSGMLILALILVLSNVVVAGLLKPLQSAMVSLEAVSKAKSNFLATMSHEIRTPMNAVIGISQIELQKGGLSDEHATAFAKIYESGNNLLRIINDVLDMSKIESGKLEINPVDYDVPSLINDTVQLNVVRIGSKPIEFILDVDENLPSRLFGDDLRLKQVLNNLLSNAIKYTASGSVKLSVSHFMSNEDFMLHFKVSDTGQGLKPEDLKKLFSEYVRFDASANRTTEGTGIGLNITQNLVKMMDGVINVESEYGKGSTFEVTIKQKVADSKPIGKELAERLSSFKFSAKKQFANLQITREPMPYGKVLIVDDVESNLYVAKGLMAPYELSLETVLSGFEAIVKIQSGNRYDIIFMDHMMPEMDGIETTQRLRNLGYTGAIVALTANAIVGNEDMFIKNGFDGFVSKPIDLRHLNSVLNKFIRDKYPEEAQKYKSKTNSETSASTSNDLTAIDPKLLEIVRSDAEKAVTTLRKTIANGDIKLFTTTAHAMKSALANVCEKEMSAAALALENAGRNGDKKFIEDNTDKFIESLLTLIEKLSPKIKSDTTDTNISEDINYLARQLPILKTACENYDVTAAYAALDLLKEKQWKKETAVALEEIRDTLFLHSDFDAAVELIDKIVSKRSL